MTRPSWLAAGLIAVLAALLCASPALAQVAAPRVDMPVSVARTVSYSTWTVEGSLVRLRFTLPHNARAALQAKGARPLEPTEIGAAILNGVGVASRGGDCDAVDQGEGMGQVYPLAMDPRVDRFEIIFQCPDSLGFVLHDHVMFDKAADHIDFAQVVAADGKARLAAFTRGHQEMAVQAPPLFSAPTVGAVLLRSVAGLFQDPLRLGMLLAVLLAMGRWPETRNLAAAAAAGYAIAFTLAGFGLEAPDVRLDRALQGLLTAAIAAGALLPAAPGRRAGKWSNAAPIAVAILLFGGGLALAVPKGAPAIMALAAAAIAVSVHAAATRRSEGAGRSIRLLLVAFVTALDGVAQTTLLSPLNASFAAAWPILAETTLGAALAVCLSLALLQAARGLARNRLAGLRTASSELVAACVAGAGLFWFASQLYSL